MVADFGIPFAGMAADRKLTRSELVRAVRFMVAAEYEAVQLYVQMAESIDHALAREVLEDIADEERVHAGEFLRLLKEIAPDEENLYARGAKEAMLRGRASLTTSDAVSGVFSAVPTGCGGGTRPLRCSSSAYRSVDTRSSSRLAGAVPALATQRCPRFVRGSK